jgi:hypothetical protein
VDFNLTIKIIDYFAIFFICCKLRDTTNIRGTT